ncbi:MAG: YifB family Mg chelatase-like AAA ATPase [Clostridia bacterium]|nr:YifB family Mg chelatase-like AAA ATPase [Clostridia bacterium]
MISTVHSFGVHGISGYKTQVETYVVRGIPEFDVIGLGDASVKESKRRVIAALKNQGYEIPSGRITVNLAPSNVKKEGTSFDLAIAVGLLCAAGVYRVQDTAPYAFIGELSLDGSVRGVHGIMAMILEGRNHGFSNFIVSKENSEEGALIRDVNVYGIENLRQIHNVLNEGVSPVKSSRLFPQAATTETDLCFSQVCGQSAVKRALEIAAIGGHHVLMLGMAGVGKTMLARRFPTILPPLTEDEIYETAAIRSACGLKPSLELLSGVRPFREIRSDITKAGLLGGRIPIMPGELSLAHRGVLFWDEMAESDRMVLDALRIPLENGEVRLSRAGTAQIYPARFQLIGATNPCRCGRHLEGNGACKCTPGEIQRYFSKISRPLLERMDIQIPVRSISGEGIQGFSDIHVETSETIRTRVIALRDLQKERYQQENITLNREITRNMIEKYCPILPAAKHLLMQSIGDLGLSMRSYEKILQIARSVADLNQHSVLTEEDIAEAVSYRRSDRIYSVHGEMEACI